jgi:hypothetical protein
MSEVVSLELLLDPETEATVRAEWDALAHAGLSSLAAHTAPSNRPHITVLVRPGVVPPALPGPLGLPLAVRLGAPMLFGEGGRRVLVRSVVPSSELLALHAAVHEAAGAGEDAPHTAPGEWMPHVTLARRLRAESIPEALALLGGELRGEVTELRLWESAAARVSTVAASLAGPATPPTSGIPAQPAPAMTG